ncbi:MAG: hypothetical protein ACRD50_14740 [Candidatus Acidiferrales bacterium]
MTVSVAVFVLLALALFVVLLYLLRSKPPENAANIALHEQPIEQLFPRHARYFSQLRQSLLEADEQFVAARCSRARLRSWQKERRRILEHYLSALRLDFALLNRLRRTISSLSPELNRQLEAEWFWLSLKFQVLYLLVLFRLRTGFAPLPQFAGLVEMLGSLAARMSAGISALEESSSP